MLQEIRAVRQDSPQAHRRWFTDADMDLFIWFKDQIPVGFQLSSGKRDIEYTLCWQRGRGYSLYCVDDGENRSARYKMSPILIDHPELNLSQLTRHFLAASAPLDPSLFDFIYARLLKYPHIRPGRSDRGGFSASRLSG